MRVYMCVCIKKIYIYNTHIHKQILQAIAQASAPMGFLRGEITPEEGISRERNAPTVGAEPSSCNFVVSVSNYPRHNDGSRLRSSIDRNIRNWHPLEFYVRISHPQSRRRIGQSPFLNFAKTFMCSRHGYHAILLLLAIRTERQLRLCHLHYGEYRNLS